MIQTEMTMRELFDLAQSNGLINCYCIPWDGSGTPRLFAVTVSARPLDFASMWDDARRAHDSSYFNWTLSHYMRHALPFLYPGKETKLRGAIL